MKSKPRFGFAAALLVALLLCLGGCGTAPAASTGSASPAPSVVASSFLPAEEASSTPEEKPVPVHTPTAEELAAMEGVITHLPDGYRPFVFEGELVGLSLITDGEAKGGMFRQAHELARLTKQQAVGKVEALLAECFTDYIEKDPARYRAEGTELEHTHESGTVYSEWFLRLYEVDTNGIYRSLTSAEVDECGRVYSIRFGTSSAIPDEELARRNTLAEDAAIKLALDTLAAEGVSFDWEIYETDAKLWENDGSLRWNITIGPKEGIEEEKNNEAFLAQQAAASAGQPLTPAPFIHYQVYDVAFNAETGADLTWLHCD